MPDHVTTIHFTRQGVHDEVTGNDTWDPWNADSDSFAAVDSPAINGYTANPETVNARKVNSDSPNQEITVTYLKKTAQNQGNHQPANNLLMIIMHNNRLIIIKLNQLTNLQLVSKRMLNPQNRLVTKEMQLAQLLKLVLKFLLVTSGKQFVYLFQIARVVSNGYLKPVMINIRWVL